MALAEKPGCKARDLVDQLGVDKKTLNSCLYSQLRGKVLQDHAYRWFLIDDQAKIEKTEKNHQKQPVI